MKQFILIMLGICLATGFACATGGCNIFVDNRSSAPYSADESSSVSEQGTEEEVGDQESVEQSDVSDFSDESSTEDESGNSENNDSQQQSSQLEEDVDFGGWHS